MSPHRSDQMSQWSQVSRIALCMAKVKVTESVSELVTRSPIELFWTAKERKSGLKVCNCALHDIDTLHSHAVTLLASQFFNFLIFRQFDGSTCHVGLSRKSG